MFDRARPGTLTLYILHSPQPFDGYGTATSAQIPEMLARQRGQCRDCCGADNAFGELTVMQKRVIREARRG